MFKQPVGNRFVQLVQLASKEMVGVLDKNKARFTRGMGHSLLNLFPGTMFIIDALHDELGLVTGFEESEIGAVHGNAQADQFVNSLVSAPHAQANPASETEPSQQHGKVGKLGGQKIQGRLHIAGLSRSTVVRSRTQSSAPKIETQNRNSQGIEDFAA